MAYLDSENVDDLVADIKALADETYPSKISLSATQRMFAPVQTNMVASQRFYIGDYVIVNDALYRITANISSGSNIVANTNAVRVLDAERRSIVVEADNVTCPERSYTTLASVTLVAGTWLLIGSHDFDESSTYAYQDVFFKGSNVLGMTRNIAGGSGGGATTTTIVTQTSGTGVFDYKAYGYGTSGTNRTARRIKLCAIQLF